MLPPSPAVPYCDQYSWDNHADQGTGDGNRVPHSQEHAQADQDESADSDSGAYGACGSDNQADSPDTAAHVEANLAASSNRSASTTTAPGAYSARSLLQILRPGQIETVW